MNYYALKSQSGKEPGRHKWTHTAFFSSSSEQSLRNYYKKRYGETRVILKISKFSKRQVTSSLKDKGFRFIKTS